MSNPTHPLLKKYTAAEHSDTPDRPRICLIRTNSIAEILAGWPLISELKQLFPHCHITTIVSEQSEAESIVAADARIDRIITLKAADGNNLTSLKAQLKGQQFDIVIAAFFAETPTRQPLRILTLLFITGRKFICFNHHWLPLASIKGIKQLLKASTAVLGGFGKKAWRLLKKRRMSKRELDISDKAIRRILWMRPDFLGDVVLCQPTLVALRQHYPNAEIDVVVQQSTASILENAPEITHIWQIDFPEFSNNPTPHVQLRQIMAEMRKRDYDIAIDLLGNDRVRELAYRLKIPIRVGVSVFANEPTSSDYSNLLTHPLRPPHLNQHYSQSRLDLLDAIGLPTKEIAPRLYAGHDSKNNVSAYLHRIGTNKSIAVIHTRTNLAAKTWDDNNFARVADYLIERYGFEVLFTGSLADKPAIENLLGLVRNRQRVHNTAGKFSLNDLIALFLQTKIMVTVDTGPMHIAAAVQTPIVALLLPYFKHCYPFGQMDSTLIPHEKSLADCFNNKQFSGKLLESITTQEVFEAIDRKMAQQNILPKEVIQEKPAAI